MRRRTSITCPDWSSRLRGRLTRLRMGRRRCSRCRRSRSRWPQRRAAWAASMRMTTIPATPTRIFCQAVTPRRLPTPATFAPWMDLTRFRWSAMRELRDARGLSIPRTPLSSTRTWRPISKLPRSTAMPTTCSRPTRGRAFRRISLSSVAPRSRGMVHSRIGSLPKMPLTPSLRLTAV